MSPGPLSSRVDFRKLAEQRASIDGVVPLRSFSRLCGLLESQEGELQVSLSFAPGKGRSPRVKGRCTGAVSMQCQNCLGPVEIPLDVPVDVFVVSTVDQLLDLEPEEDGLVCEDKLLPVVDIIEDELMVNLPMVPRHSDGECGETFRPEPDVVEQKPDTHRPFAGLEGLKKDLKRSE